ncbi:MAG: hypothetical protein K0S21_692 [Rhizobiaceae bacterium]|nr:hypothetical protein [Rhizobiaceae bacterium]
MEALGRQNKGKGWGAGALYNDYATQLRKRGSARLQRGKNAAPKPAKSRRAAAKPRP